MTSSRACGDSGFEKSMPRISAPSAGDNLREIMRIPVVTMFERDALRSESEYGVIFDIRSKIGFLIELKALKNIVRNTRCLAINYHRSLSEIGAASKMDVKDGYRKRCEIDGPARLHFSVAGSPAARIARFAPAARIPFRAFTSHARRAPVSNDRRPLEREVRLPTCWKAKFQGKLKRPMKGPVGGRVEWWQ
nr:MULTISPECIES: hypothetical protein [unclassified Burkholderia]